MLHLGRRPLLALAGLLAAPGLVRAQAFPQRNVTVLVPSAPGGTLDALARFYAQALSPVLGRSVVVENVSGAGGIVGMLRLARSEPDGHTLAFGNMGIMAAGFALTPDSGFDPRRDMAPIGLVADVPMVLATSPRGDLRTLDDLLARLRRDGERVSFGTAGVGATSYLAPAYLTHLAGVKATLVSYRGSGPAMNDLAAGVVDAVIDQTVTMIPAHRGNTARAVAVSAPARLPQLPDVPTFAEAGRPDFDLVIWNAFAAPPGTPAAVIERLQAALEAAMDDGTLRGKLGELATVLPPPDARGPEAMRRRIAGDVTRWTAIVQESGLGKP